jgi:hypothetical protein
MDSRIRWYCTSEFAIFAELANSTIFHKVVIIALVFWSTFGWFGQLLGGLVKLLGGLVTFIRKYK